VFHVLLLSGCALLGQGPAPADTAEVPPSPQAAASPERPSELLVRRWVRQLEADSKAERDEAEEALIGLGPAALEFLPPPTPRTPADLRLRLERIRQKLQRAAAVAAAGHSLVSLPAGPQRLSKIFESITQQTGNPIVDFRGQFGQPVTDPELTVAMENRPFWEALDRVLDEAGLTVYPYGQKGAIAVVNRPDTERERGSRAAYSGPFRIEATTVTARRDLRNPQTRWLQVALEVAWEPRLVPIAISQRLSDTEAVDENGRSLAGDTEGVVLEARVDPNATATELKIPLALPSREVKQIAKLRGTLTAMVPGRIETFRFGDLMTAKDRSVRIAGATVILEQVRRNNQVWEVRMRVRYDEAGKALESHRAWILHNEAYLEGPDGKPIANAGCHPTRQTENEVGLSYLFSLDDPPENHTFVYKTPGLIVSRQFAYEFENIDLP